MRFAQCHESRMRWSCIQVCVSLCVHTRVLGDGVYLCHVEQTRKLPRVKQQKAGREEAINTL